MCKIELIEEGLADAVLPFSLAKYLTKQKNKDKMRKQEKKRDNIIYFKIYGKIEFFTVCNYKGKNLLYVLAISTR